MADDLKAYVESLDLPKTISKIKRSYYAHDTLILTGEIIECAYDFETALQLEFDLRKEYGDKVYSIAENVLKARNKKVQRLRKRIKHIFRKHNESVFVTLTFRDDVLSSTDGKTRRVYVSRFLNSQTDEYVGNIDFGEKNGREHYHAVVGGRINPKQWNYGCCNVQRIRVDDKTSSYKLARYITKLTYHAIKDSTERHSLIYSRKTYNIKDIDLDSLYDTLYDDTDGFIDSLFPT